MSEGAGSMAGSNASLPDDSAAAAAAAGDAPAFEAAAEALGGRAERTGPTHVESKAPKRHVRFRSARMPSGPFWIALLLFILGAIVFVLSASGLFVFGIGVAMAFFLVPIVNWLDRRGWNRVVASIIVVVVTILAALFVLGASVLIIVNQGLKFIQELPTYLADLQAWYASADLPEWLRAGLDTLIASIHDNLAGVDQGTVVAGFLGGLLGFVGGLFAWFLLPFFLFYLIKDQPKMANTFYARVPEPWQADVSRMLTITVGNFAQYFKAEFLVGGIMFAFVTVGMVVIGAIVDAPQLIQFALLLGLIAFVMELIPQIGPILSYIPALILALPAGTDAVVLVSVFYFIAFNIEGSVLVPTFEGRMISFNGATVLVLIAMGFILGGIIGAILALPLASIIRDLFRHFFDKAVEDGLVVEQVTAGDGAGGDAAEAHEGHVDRGPEASVDKGPEASAATT